MNKLIKHICSQPERRHTIQSILNGKVCDARDGCLMLDISSLQKPIACYIAAKPGKISASLVVALMEAHSWYSRQLQNDSGK